MTHLDAAHATMTSMNVLFDARYIRTDYHDGISRYTTELANAIHPLLACTFLICDEKQRKLLPKNARTLLIHAPTSSKEPFTALLLNKYSPDVVFSPMQTIGSFGKRFKLILTVHDLIYFSHPKSPGQFNWPLRIGWRIYHSTYAFQKKVLRGADVVATVSNTTKNAMELVGMDQRPIVVIPNAAPTSNKAVKHYAGPAEHLIYMGSFMPYKNVESLIDAMQWLPGKTLHLLSRITSKRKKELLKRADSEALIVFHNGVSDAYYQRLLRNKAVLLNASLNEGYGLPLAEALSQGVPMAVSDIDTFHEVANKGALYFDPQDPKDIAETIKKLDSADTRATLSTAGIAHAQKSSWHESARRLKTLIESLV